MPMPQSPELGALSIVDSTWYLPEEWDVVDRTAATALPLLLAAVRLPLESVMAAVLSDGLNVTEPVANVWSLDVAVLPCASAETTA